jgi:hypothetical protein
MVNRWSGVLLIVGALAGYAISGTTLRAQDGSLPFAIGDTVTLRFGAPWSAEWTHFVVCEVNDIRGTYVKCAAPASARPRRPEAWHNMQSVAMVEKQQ